MVDYITAQGIAIYKDQKTTDRKIKRAGKEDNNGYNLQKCRGVGRKRLGCES